MEKKRKFIRSFHVDPETLWTEFEAKYPRPGNFGSLFFRMFLRAAQCNLVELSEEEGEMRMILHGGMVTESGEVFRSIDPGLEIDLDDSVVHETRPLSELPSDSVEALLPAATDEPQTITVVSSSDLVFINRQESDEPIELVPNLEVDEQTLSRHYETTLFLARNATLFLNPHATDSDRDQLVILTENCIDDPSPETVASLDPILERYERQIAEALG